MKPPEEVRLEFAREWLDKAGKGLSAGRHLLADGQAQKVVYLPYEATGLMGSIGCIKEMFADGSKAAVPAGSVASR